MSGLEKLKNVLEKNLAFFMSIPGKQDNEKAKAYRDGKLSCYYFVINLVNSLIKEEEIDA